MEASALSAELAALMEEAGLIAQKARSDFQRELKPDGSIVTRGDRIVEEFLRERLTRLVPGSSVWGEELGWAAEGEGGLWAVDPIDGTTNYAYGSPLWGCTAAYLKKGSILAGAIRLPDLNETFRAALGGGAWLGETRLKPIPPGPIRREDPVSVTDSAMRAHPHVTWPGKLRCSGSFVVDATFTAMQRFRGMVGIREMLYDLAASHLLLTELDADIRYLDGAEFRIEDLLDGRKIGRAWLMFPRGSGFGVASSRDH